MCRYTRQELQELLDSHYHAHNHPHAISEENPDPLLAVYPYRESENLAEIALVCALFSYGNVRAILGFLRSLDFHLLGSLEEILEADFPYYRFQSSEDVKLLFASLRGLLDSGGLASSLSRGILPLDAIATLQAAILLHARRILGEARYGFPARYQKQFLAEGFSQGFRFLIGSRGAQSPQKRWNLFLRWLVRSDCIDLGLWQGLLSPSTLLLPLDTHTFRVCRKLMLLGRRSYDSKAVQEVSSRLASFCPSDPVRYDFALYRLGQQGLI